MSNKKHMAHNIYSNPVLNETSRKFEGFSIDFRGVQTPVSTYWALCNWGMDLTSFKAQHPDARGCGAYAGLQNTVIGRKMILSFWELFYEGESKRQTATRIYPKGKESEFGGEGEGTNYIADYPWEDNTWYRMVLRSWKNAESGSTYVGQWLQNRKTGEWTLASYFDTKLVDSCFIGGMSQFQENFWDEHSQFIREFNLKNIYVKDLKDGEWKYIEGTSLSYDDPKWHFNTAGTHNVGATTEYFFGNAGGDVEDQLEYDAVRPISAVYRVQKSEEFIDEQMPCGVILEKEQEGRCSVLKIENDPFKIPLLTLTIRMDNGSGQETLYHCRPDETSVILPLAPGASCKVTATDIYGRCVDYDFSV